MANTTAQDNMATLWDEVTQGTDQAATLSKLLPMYPMSEVDGERSADQEWIPSEFRFTPLDGIVSTDSDFEDLIDRMVPIRRSRSKRILFRLSTKQLRDPRLRANAIKGIQRDIRNAVDTVCYQEIIDQSTMVLKSTSDYEWEDATDSEITMVNNGLSAYEKTMWLSNTDYAKVAKTLGAYQYKDGIPKDALTKAKIPDLATFDTYRSDFLLPLAANAVTNATINGAQEHTVATYTDSNNDNYLDNRSMTLNMNNGITTAVGTKFTVAGINAVNPETRTDTGELRTFTVIGGTSLAPIIQPAIVASGAYQNCSAVAADTAAVTVLNNVTSNPSVFWAKDSVYLIAGNLPVEGGGVDVMESTTEQGLPMRMTYQWNFHDEVFECKALIFFDVAVVSPEQVGCNLSNQT